MKKHIYVFFLLVASNPFIIFALFTKKKKRREKNQYRLTDSVSLAKYVDTFSFFWLGVELSSIENFFNSRPRANVLTMQSFMVIGFRTPQFNLWPVRNVHRMCINWALACNLPVRVIDSNYD